MLLDDPAIRRVLELWREARCAIKGIGAPPALRTSPSRFVPIDGFALEERSAEAPPPNVNGGWVGVGFDSRGGNRPAESSLCEGRKGRCPG